MVGGVAIKTFAPDILSAVTHCVLEEGLGGLPDGALTTIYRVEIDGILYYSKQYERVSKRNSYIPSYQQSSEEKKCFGFIECFIYVHNNVIAVVKSINVLPDTHKYFQLTSPEMCSQILHVEVKHFFTAILASRIVKKCLFIEFGSLQCIVQFPSTVLFD